MPSSYSTNLLLELMADGENDGLWGDITNENLEILGRAAGGVGTVTLAGTTHTLTVTQGALSEGHYSVLVLTGSPTGTNTITISPNTVTRTYLVKNSSGEDAVFTQGSGTNVTVANGNSAILFCDGGGAAAAVTELTAGYLRGANNLSDLDDPATALQNLGAVATPATTTDGGVALFDGTDGSALKDGGTQDAIINGMTVGLGNGDAVNPVLVNTVVGKGAGASLTTGTRGVYVGLNAGASVTTGGAVCVGEGAGRNTTTGGGTFVGRRAGESNVTGVLGTAIGAGAAQSATNLSSTVIGGSAMDDAVQDTSCVFVGYLAGDRIGVTTFNIGNVGVGNNAVSSGISATVTSDVISNTAFGYQALSGTTFATDGNAVFANTAIGHEAMRQFVSGEYNTALGYRAGYVGSPFQITTQSNRVVIGNNDVTNAYIKVSWTVTSDERDKTDFAALSQGLDVVDAIDTFTFKFDNRSSYFVYDEDGNVIDTPTPDGTYKSERTFVGFKAQQVRDVLDAAGFPSDVVVDTEDPDNLKMKETALIPLLINAIKELKARVEVLEGS